MPDVHGTEERVHVAFDASRGRLVAGVLRPPVRTPPTIERAFNDEPSIRRLVRAFPGRASLRTGDEARPAGDALRCLLASMTVSCVPTAPSRAPTVSTRVPTPPGDRGTTGAR